MLTAFVLIHAAPDRIHDLAADIADVDGVAEVYSVTGEWDLLAVVRVKQQEQLAEVVTEHLAELAGIERTTTMVAFKGYSRHDLEAMWGLGLD